MLTNNFAFGYIQTENLPLLITSAVGTIITSFAVHFALRTTRIQPGEPPLLPGALPLLGHAIRYGKGANKIFHEATYVVLTLPTCSRNVCFATGGIY
jgi:hypothetical protein